jgi:hypothetical protein
MSFPYRGCQDLQIEKTRPKDGRVLFVYRAFGAGAVVDGASGVVFGVITRGAVEVPVVMPGVELLVAGVELLTAVRLLLPQGPNSMSAPTITAAATIAAMVPVPIPVRRSSRRVRLSVLRADRLSRPG